MQEVGLDDLATGWDFLVLQGLLYGLSGREAGRRASELLDLVGLAEVASRKVGTYSGGMRRRIDLGAALMHNPPLLFLDEPTSGLDPQSRFSIWEHLGRLDQQGITIFLTTQMMEEADRLCKRIAIIDHGQIVADGSPQALKSEVGGDVIRVALADAAREGNLALAETAATLLRERPYVESVSIQGNTLTIMAGDGSAAAPDMLRLLYEHRVPVENLTVASPTLDDVFLKYTGRQIRSEETSGDELGHVMRSFLGFKRR